MNKIIEIKENGLNRFDIYADGDLSACVTREFMCTQTLSDGDICSEEDFSGFLSDAQNDSAFIKALDILSYANRSSGELRRKLLPLFGSDAADYAIERLTESGIINDEFYAECLAAELSELRGFGKMRISAELEKRGIPRQIAKSAAEQASVNSDDSIKRLLETKFKNSLKDEKSLARTINSLKRMGHSWYDIKSAVQEYLNGPDTDSLFDDFNDEN